MTEFIGLKGWVGGEVIHGGNPPAKRGEVPWLLLGWNGEALGESVVVAVNCIDTQQNTDCEGFYGTRV